MKAGSVKTGSQSRIRRRPDHKSRMCKSRITKKPVKYKADHLNAGVIPQTGGRENTTGRLY
jgi:hypothetical protein